MKMPYDEYLWEALLQNTAWTALIGSSCLQSSNTKVSSQTFHLRPFTWTCQGLKVELAIWTGGMAPSLTGSAQQPCGPGEGSIQRSQFLGCLPTNLLAPLALPWGRGGKGVAGSWCGAYASPWVAGGTVVMAGGPGGMGGRKSFFSGPTLALSSPASVPHSRWGRKQMDELEEKLFIACFCSWFRKAGLWCDA